MEIPIKLLRDMVELPAYQTAGAAAMDVAAALDEPVTLQPGARQVIPAGFALELPMGFEAQLRARSGLSFTHGICLANGVATIDSDYRGEVGVILINLSDQAFVVTPGMRIAQMVIAPCIRVTWRPTDTISDTDRGSGGFGSTSH